MKKILITGINGFIGSHCRDFFIKKGSRVFGIDLCGYPHTDFVLGEADLANLCSFNQQFDIIIHLAGSATVSAAQQAPDIEKTKSVNSTREILEYIKNFNPKARLILASSAAVYGNSCKNPIDEEQRPNPISIYGLHKLEAENLCTFYSQNHNLNIKIIRFFSLYGDGLKKQLLWDFLNRIDAVKSDKMTCFGTGNEERDFVHIDDAVNFINLICQQEKSFKFKIYNCASGRSTQIKTLMHLLLKEYNKPINLVFDNIKRQGNPDILVANINKAQELGFFPEVTLEEGIKRYASWFKEVH